MLAMLDTQSHISTIAKSVLAENFPEEIRDVSELLDSDTALDLKTAMVPLYHPVAISCYHLVYMKGKY